VAERSNAAVSKTVSGLWVRRGFKSLPLRSIASSEGAACPRRASYGGASAKPAAADEAVAYLAVTVVWLVYADGEVWMQTTKDPQVLHRGTVSSSPPQRTMRTPRRESGIAPRTAVARFTAFDVAAMKRMSGCP
jgi:hypothetical protein